MSSVMSLHRTVSGCPWNSLARCPLGPLLLILKPRGCSCSEAEQKEICSQDPLSRSRAAEGDHNTGGHGATGLRQPRPGDNPGLSICRSFFVTKCLKPTVSDCDLSPQLPALYPGLASPFGKFLQLGLCQAGGVWQPLCQRLAEPAQSCHLRLSVTVAVIWGAFPCPLCPG